MTCCCQHSRAPLSTGWVSGRGVRELLRAAWRAYWEYRVEHAGAEFLRLLDADALRDIGLEPSDLDAVLSADGRRRQGECPCHASRQDGSSNGLLQGLSVLAAEPADGKAAYPSHVRPR